MYLLIAAINASKQSMTRAMKQELVQFQSETRDAQEEVMEIVARKVKKLTFKKKIMKSSSFLIKTWKRKWRSLRLSWRKLQY